MRAGKTLRQRFEELGFKGRDSDEQTHDALDEIEELRAPKKSPCRPPCPRFDTWTEEEHSKDCPANT